MVRRRGSHTPLPDRLEKEYAAMKSKEMEEQIEIKVSPGSGEQDGAHEGSSSAGH